MDYNLANLIGISIGRCLDSSAKMPSLYEAYSGIFSQEDAAEAQNQLNIQRFREFAAAYTNKKNNNSNTQGR